MNHRAATPAKYRIVVVDDQFPTREGLKLILESEPDMIVAGMARNGAEACELVEALAPDLVLMDVHMPVMDGIESTRRIKARHPRVQVMILSTFMEDEYIVEGLAYGACGYLLKDMEGDKLLSSIRDAAAGQFVLTGPVAQRLAQYLARRGVGRTEAAAPPPLKLTEREEEIADQLVRGLTNREIGAALGISDGTVRNYISGLYGKLDVASRAEAIVRLLYLRPASAPRQS